MNINTPSPSHHILIYLLINAWFVMKRNCVESFIFHAWTKKHNFVKFDVFFLSLSSYRSFLSSNFLLIRKRWKMKPKSISKAFFDNPRHAGKFDFSFKSFDILFSSCIHVCDRLLFYNSYMLSFTWHHHLLFKYAHRSLLWHSKWYSNKK